MKKIIQILAAITVSVMSLSVNGQTTLTEKKLQNFFMNYTGKKCSSKVTRNDAINITVLVEVHAYGSDPYLAQVWAAHLDGKVTYWLVNKYKEEIQISAMTFEEELLIYICTSKTALLRHAACITGKFSDERIEFIAQGPDNPFIVVRKL